MCFSLAMFSHTALLQVQFEEKMKQMSEQWTREMTKVGRD